MFTVKDAQLKITRALPNGATSVTSTGFDLGLGSRGDLLADVELVLTAPTLNNSQLPDGQTVTYDVQSADDSSFSTNLTTVALGVLVQTGAGGAGAAGSTLGIGLPVDCRRYVRLKATKTGAADASTASATIEIAA